VQKRLIIALSVSLGVSLLVIAFLAGRLRTPPPVVGNESQPAVAEPSIARKPQQLPADVQDTPLPSKAEALVHEPSLPPRGPVQALPPTVQPVIQAYFAKIDSIRSPGAGDPMTFAQGIVGGLQAGDTSGLDSLVSSAKLALAQATSVQPPPVCAEYHRRLLESLSESVAGMDKLRNTLKKGDVGDLAALAAQFQASQQKVDDLERMKQQLLGQ